MAPSSGTSRQITDSRVLAAMSHPMRRRLMDVLRLEGASTVSALAEAVDTRVGNVSHHLGVLAAADLVVEVPERARDRRERWWQLVSTSLRWSSADLGDSPSSTAAVRAAESLNLERHVAAVRSWYGVDDATHAAWADAAFATDSWLRLTPNELRELSEQLTAVLHAWADRDAVAEDGTIRAPVLVFAHGVPARP